MSLLFVDGFDAQDAVMKWDVATTPSEVWYRATTPYGVGRSLETSFDDYLSKRFSPSSVIYVGLAVLINDPSMTVRADHPGVLHILGDSDTVNHLTIRAATGSDMGLFRGTTLLGSFSFTAMTWHYIEIYAKIDDANGEYTVKLDGQIVLQATNVDTRNGGTDTSIDAIHIGSCSNSNAYLDDLYISDSEFLGEIRVQTLVPTAAGSSTQLTPNGGANYANVADIPDVTTTNNSSSTVGHKDLYTMGDLASSTATVKAVQVNNHARKTDVGSIGMRNVVKSGATTANGATKSLSASTTWTGDVLETDPDTSAAWTATAVNSLEAGAEVA